MFSLVVWGGEAPGAAGSEGGRKGGRSSMRCRGVVVGHAQQARGRKVVGKSRARYCPWALGACTAALLTRSRRVCLSPCLAGVVGSSSGSGSGSDGSSGSSRAYVGSRLVVAAP